LTMHEIPLIIIDSMGIDSRREGFFAKIHGRYRTIGFSDVRAVSPYLIPIFSCNCRSTDSEAMNIIEIINHAKSILGEGFKFCAGNAHTVSRVATGLAFADHKVILLGRYPHPSIKPGKICLSRLLKHLDLINKAGKLVREDSEFGPVTTWLSPYSTYHLLKQQQDRTDSYFSLTLYLLQTCIIYVNTLLV
ncbi:MAG: hypothetical protein QSU88_08835, partial [Candidatus Methanoperedens sp.]|nr:hypothetical protein [Candidatus Methanoperedens sp.]